MLKWCYNPPRLYEGKSKKVKGKRDKDEESSITLSLICKSGFRHTFAFLLLPFAFPLPFDFERIS